MHLCSYLCIIHRRPAFYLLEVFYLFIYGTFLETRLPLPRLRNSNSSHRSTTAQREQSEGRGIIITNDQRLYFLFYSVKWLKRPLFISLWFTFNIIYDMRKYGLLNIYDVSNRQVVVKECTQVEKIVASS